MHEKHYPFLYFLICVTFFLCVLLHFLVLSSKRLANIIQSYGFTLRHVRRDFLHLLRTVYSDKKSYLISPKKFSRLDLSLANNIPVIKFKN